MDVFDSIWTMMRRRGLSARRLSTMLGRESSYMNSVLYKRRVPSVNLMVTIAKICGYDLALISHENDETIRIHVPREGDSTD